MDLTVDTTRPGSGVVYLEHTNRLIALGARRILFFGLATRSADLLPRLEAYSGTFKLELAVCDHRAGTAELSGLKVRALGAEAALREGWDVVIASDPVASPGAFAFADAIGESTSVYPHVVYAGKRARAALVVSLPKCGTHLVSRVMVRLGYDVHVPPKVPADLWPRLQLDPFDLPDNCCYVPPNLPVLRVPDQSTERWHEKRDPSVFFTYRDPRDALISVLHYLMGEAKEAFTPIGMNIAHSAILKALPNAHARLMHAIHDETFPFRGSFAANAWLLRHPLVQKVSFERLIGASGGGSDELQLAEIRGILRHVNAPGDAAEIAKSVFDRSQRTFFRGQIGAFKKEFSPDHLVAYNAQFREITARYGYDPDASLDARS